MSLIHGRQPEGEKLNGTNPVVIGAKDINGKAIFLTADADGKLQVATDLQVASVTATDVTIHDPTTPQNKLKVNADGSIPTTLSGSIPEYGWVVGDAEPTPDRFAFGIKVDPATGSITTMYWNETAWAEVE